MLVLLIIIVITELTSTTLGEKGHNTFPITRIYTIAEFTSLLFFYKFFFTQHFKNTFFYIILILFYILAIIDAFIINSIYSSDTLASSTEGIIMIILSVSAFYLIIKKMLYSNIMNEPFFWMNSAYLIYFSGTLFLFLFLNYLLKNEINYYTQLYFINSLLNFVNYTLISIGFWKTRKA